MLSEAKRFLELNPNDLHTAEIEKNSILAKTKLENIWNMLSESEQAIREALNFGLDEPKLVGRKTVLLVCLKFTGYFSCLQEQLYSDRYSDSNIEDKLMGRNAGCTIADEKLKKIMEPMKELLKSEKDYIEDLR